MSGRQNNIIFLKMYLLKAISLLVIGSVCINGAPPNISTRGNIPIQHQKNDILLNNIELEFLNDCDKNRDNMFLCAEYKSMVNEINANNIIVSQTTIDTALKSNLDIDTFCDKMHNKTFTDSILKNFKQNQFFITLSKISRCNIYCNERIENIIQNKPICRLIVFGYENLLVPLQLTNIQISTPNGISGNEPTIGLKTPINLSSAVPDQTKTIENKQHTATEALSKTKDKYPPIQITTPLIHETTKTIKNPDKNVNNNNITIENVSEVNSETGTKPDAPKPKIPSATLPEPELKKPDLPPPSMQKLNLPPLIMQKPNLPDIQNSGSQALITGKPNSQSTGKPNSQSAGKPNEEKVNSKPENPIIGERIVPVSQPNKPDLKKSNENEPNAEQSNDELTSMEKLNVKNANAEEQNNVEKTHVETGNSNVNADTTKNKMADNKIDEEKLPKEDGPSIGEEKDDNNGIEPQDPLKNDYDDDDGEDNGMLNDEQPLDDVNSLNPLENKKKENKSNKLDEPLDNTLFDNNKFQQPDQVEIHPDPFVDDEDSNFFTYFMFLMLICIMAYVAYHNKNKVLAIVLEGRRSSGFRNGIGRRKHTAAYRKLDTNLEEAISSNASGRTTQIIY